MTEDYNPSRPEPRQFYEFTKVNGDSESVNILRVAGTVEVNELGGKIFRVEECTPFEEH